MIYDPGNVKPKSFVLMIFKRANRNKSYACSSTCLKRNTIKSNDLTLWISNLGTLLLDAWRRYAMIFPSKWFIRMAASACCFFDDLCSTEFSNEWFICLSTLEFSVEPKPNNEVFVGGGKHYLLNVPIFLRWQSHFRQHSHKNLGLGRSNENFQVFCSWNFQALNHQCLQIQSVLLIVWVSDLFVIDHKKNSKKKRKQKRSTRNVNENLTPKLCKSKTHPG